ncbi:MAG: diguanylate cyclase [Actinomycetota bacterium]|nr:diguanylate cyclase [Actinomycetota bacterium]
MEQGDAAPFDRLPIAVMVVRGGVVIEANRAARDLLGVTDGTTLAETFPEGERAAVAAFVAEPSEAGVVARLRTGVDLCALHLRATRTGDVLTVVAQDITNERRLSGILEGISDSCSVFDANGAVFWESQGALEHYERWNLVPGASILLEWTHPNDLPKVLDLFTRAVQGEVTRAYFETRWHPPGYDEWFHSRHLGYSGFDDPDVGGIVHVGFEKERVDVEQMEGTEQGGFFTLAEAAPVGILIGMPEGYIAFSNKLAERLLGRIDRAPGEWFLVTRSEFHDELRSVWDGALRGEQGKAVGAVDGASGDRTWIQVTAVPQLGTDGRPTGAIATIEDITDSVTARRDAERVLRVLDTGYDFVVITDRDGQVVHVNAAAAERLGLRADGSAEDVLRTTVEPALDRDALASLAETGTWTGELALRGADGQIVPVSVVAVAERGSDGGIESYAFVCRDISDLKAVEEQLREMATHDALTGLPNRSLLLDALHAALARHRRTGKHLALLFCDLDGFKLVNDDAGHEAGDAVLREVADRLRAVVRAGDIVARIGGDEFVVLCEDFAAPEHIHALVERITDRLAQPVATEQGVARVGVSVGLATTDADGDDGDGLLAAADRHMYEVKRRRKTQAGYADAV